MSPSRDLSPRLLDEWMREWLPDAHLRRQVLAVNPARLYGF